MWGAPRTIRSHTTRSTRSRVTGTGVVVIAWVTEGAIMASENDLTTTEAQTPAADAVEQAPSKPKRRRATKKASAPAPVDDALFVAEGEAPDTWIDRARVAARELSAGGPAFDISRVRDVSPEARAAENWIRVCCCTSCSRRIFLRMA